MRRSTCSMRAGATWPRRALRMSGVSTAITPTCSSLRLPHFHQQEALGGVVHVPQMLGRAVGEQLVERVVVVGVDVADRCDGVEHRGLVVGRGRAQPEGAWRARRPWARRALE